MKCAIFIMDDDANPQLAGTFKFAHGRISAQVTKGYETAMQNFLKSPNITAGGKTSVTATSDPAKWFQALPENYQGTYVRAQMLPKKELQK